MTYFPIKDLKRADYNPRRISPSEMESLMTSIETHGFVEPIVVNVSKERYGTIVGGHQRLTAVEKLIAKGIIPKGIKDATHAIIEHAQAGHKAGPVGVYWIPAFEVDLTLEAEKELNIGLNRIHGKFDEELLYNMIVDMKDSPTLPSTGLSPDEVSSVLDFGHTVKRIQIDKHQCDRCRELKLQVLGHARRTSHPIWIKDDNEEKK